MNIPILSVTGTSNSGKTTLMEKIIAELSRRGYRVAAVKHTLHDFDIDQKGKDSWRHRQAGAVTSVLSSSRMVAVIEKVSHDLSIAELTRRYVEGVDIVIVEGHKKNDYPKIVMVSGKARELSETVSRKNILAFACDSEVETTLPVFHRNDARGITDLIENRLLAPLKKSTAD